MTMISALRMMHRLKDLAGIVSEHTTLKPDKNAEQCEPCEQ